MNILKLKDIQTGFFAQQLFETDNCRILKKQHVEPRVSLEKRLQGKLDPIL